MKIYKEDIKTIFEVLSYIAILFMFIMIDNEIMVVSGGILSLTFWSFNIYDKLQYRKHEFSNEIRFPTQNDSYFKVTSLTLGSLLIIGMIVTLLVMKEFSYLPIFGLIAGILILINGILDLPKGILKIENSTLKINRLIDGIELNEIHSINVNSNQIVINKKEEDAMIKLENLLLNEKWISIVIGFLNLTLETENIEITCGNST